MENVFVDGQHIIVDLCERSHVSRCPIKFVSTRDIGVLVSQRLQQRVSGMRPRSRVMNARLSGFILLIEFIARRRDVTRTSQNVVPAYNLRTVV